MTVKDSEKDNREGEREDDDREREGGGLKGRRV